MQKFLYPCFQHWPGSVWFYSDPHFEDPDVQFFRDNSITDLEQVANINKKVGKDNTIVFLGDIGNTDYIKKIKGYKVLIKGNHDTGSSNYIRKQKIEYICSQCSQDLKDDKICYMHGKIDNPKTFIRDDNHLFDEVYEGPLLISDKIILSHEPVNYKYALNIHGHVHKPNIHLVCYLINYGNDNIQTKINVCAENINYTPLCLSNIIKSGALHDVKNIHRETIDYAIANSIKSNAKL